MGHAICPKILRDSVLCFKTNIGRRKLSGVTFRQRSSCKCDFFCDGAQNDYTHTSLFGGNYLPNDTGHLFHWKYFV